MKKIVALLFLSLCSLQYLHAQGIKLLDNKSWAEVKALAKKENKMIFLDAYATWCGPCVYMQKKVFTSPKAGEYFNRNFINVKIDMEKGEGPWLAQDLGLVGYPTLYFFNPDGELVHKYIGALETEDFIALAQEARQPEKQFYTLKRKATEGTLDPELFHSWIHTANDFGEEDVEETITTYLAGIPNLTADKHLAIIILDHASSITEDQFNVLNSQADKLALLTEVPKDAVMKQLHLKRQR